MQAGSATRLGIWTEGKKEHRDRGGMHVHFALAVSREEFESLISELRAEDREFEGPVLHDGGGRSIYLSDPEGNRVEFLEQESGEDRE
jgi:catechol-2,3-dioxygenase